MSYSQIQIAKIMTLTLTLTLIPILIPIPILTLNLTLIQQHHHLKIHRKMKMNHLKVNQICQYCFIIFTIINNPNLESPTIIIITTNNLFYEPLSFCFTCQATKIPIIKHQHLVSYLKQLTNYNENKLTQMNYFQ